MKKKFLGMMLIITLVASIFVGCGKDEVVEREPYVPTEQDLSKITIGPYNWPVHQGIDYTKSYNKRFDGLTFEYAMGGTGTDLPEGQTLEENIYTWTLEGICGLKTKVVWNAGGAAYSQKIGQAITNGDIPDLMYVDLQQYRTLVKAGLIADLTEELLEEEHPTIQKIYAERNNEALEALKIDGRIYGIPSVAASYDGSPLIWIRKDWMEKLELEEPKSLDDLEQIALAFMERDPDGNGKKDTYGIPCTSSFSAGYGGEGSLGNIMLNIGGAAPSCWIEQDDGTLIFGSLMDEAKEALVYLNKWYQKGILPEDFATWDSSEIGRVIGNDQAGIVFAPWYGAVMGINNSISLNSNAEWAAYLLPQEEGGQVYAAEGDPLVGIYVVSKDFEYPEAFVYAYDMMESFGNEFNQGAPDPEFTYFKCEGYVSAPSAYKPVGSPLPGNFYYGPIDTVVDNAESVGGLASLKSTDEVKSLLEGKVSDPLIRLRLNEFTYSALDVYFADQAGQNPREVVNVGDNALASYQHYLLYWAGPKAISDADPIGVSSKYMGTTKSMSMYSTFLSNFEKESYTNMVMGRTDGKTISEYFDNFVEKYLEQGGSVITKEVNEDYKNR